MIKDIVGWAKADIAIQAMKGRTRDALKQAPAELVCVLEFTRHVLKSPEGRQQAKAHLGATDDFVERMLSVAEQILEGDERLEKLFPEEQRDSSGPEQEQQA